MYEGQGGDNSMNSDENSTTGSGSKPQQLGGVLQMPINVLVCTAFTLQTRR